jgi:type VI secretion system secreted protein Hcp
MKSSISGRARKAIRIVLAAGAAVGASQQALADDLFLKIPGIPGESVDDKHKDEIDILSFSQSVEGKSCQISFTKRVDKASPVLAEAAATRKPIPSATLVVRRITDYKDQSDEYIKLTMSFVTVLSSDISLSGEYAEENITVNTRSILIGLRPQGPDGKLGTEVSKSISCSGPGGKF